MESFRQINNLGVIKNQLDKKGGFKISQADLKKAKDEYLNGGGKIEQVEIEYQTYEEWGYNSAKQYSSAGYSPRGGSE